MLLTYLKTLEIDVDSFTTKIGYDDVDVKAYYDYCWI